MTTWSSTNSTGPTNTSYYDNNRTHNNSNHSRGDTRIQASDVDTPGAGHFSLRGGIKPAQRVGYLPYPAFPPNAVRPPSPFTGGSQCPSTAYDTYRNELLIRITNPWVPWCTQMDPKLDKKPNRLHTPYLILACAHSRRHTRNDWPLVTNILKQIFAIMLRTSHCMS